MADGEIPAIAGVRPTSTSARAANASVRPANASVRPANASGILATASVEMAEVAVNEWIGLPDLKIRGFGQKWGWDGLTDFRLALLRAVAQLLVVVHPKTL